MNTGRERDLVCKLPEIFLDGYNANVREVKQVKTKKFCIYKFLFYDSEKYIIEHFSYI